MPTTPEQAFPAAPAFASRGLVASSFQYLLTGTEELRLTAYVRSTQIRLTVDSRLWRRDIGEIQLQSHECLTSTLFETVQTYPLTAGALLNVRVSTPGNPTLQLGQVFVRVQLMSGSGPGARVVGTLLQGYLDEWNELAWPGTPLADMQSGLGVLLNAGWSLDLPNNRAMTLVASNARWRVMSGRVVFTAGAVPAVRNFYVSVQDPAGVLQFVGTASTNLAAGGVFGLNFGAGLVGNRGVDFGNESVPFPVDLDLLPNSIIAVNVVNMQVGDFFSALDGLWVREWMNP